MTSRSITRVLVFCMAATLGLVSFGNNCHAGSCYITPDPGLPPGGGAQKGGYVEIINGVWVYINTVFEISGGIHTDFTNISVFNIGTNEFESFNSTFSGMLSINGGTATPVTLNGSVEVEAFGKAGMTTGTFNTQMLSLDMTGTVGGKSVEIQLDSNLGNSTGQTTITAIPNNLYCIMSYFNLENGDEHQRRTVCSADQSALLVELETIPEPSPWIMSLTAGLAVPAYARWGGGEPDHRVGMADQAIESAEHL